MARHPHSGHDSRGQMQTSGSPVWQPGGVQRKPRRAVGAAGPSPDLPTPGRKREEALGRGYPDLSFVGKPFPDNQENRRGGGRSARVPEKSWGAPPHLCCLPQSRLEACNLPLLAWTSPPITSHVWYPLPMVSIHLLPYVSVGLSSPSRLTVHLPIAFQPSPSFSLPGAPSLSTSSTPVPLISLWRVCLHLSSLCLLVP